MMEQDLIEAKKYLSQQGYGSGTNYTSNLVAVLLANYAKSEVEKFRLADVVGRSEQLVCTDCGGTNIQDTDYGKQCRTCFEFV